MQKLASLRVVVAAVPLRRIAPLARVASTGLRTRPICTASSERVPIVFLQEGEEVQIDAEVGKSILEIAHDNDVELEGQLASSTP